LPFLFLCPLVLAISLCLYLFTYWCPLFIWSCILFLLSFSFLIILILIVFIIVVLGVHCAIYKSSYNVLYLNSPFPSFFFIPPPLIPRTALAGLIFPFTWIYTQYWNHIHPSLFIFLSILQIANLSSSSRIFPSACSNLLLRTYSESLISGIPLFNTKISIEFLFCIFYFFLNTIYLFGVIYLFFKNHALFSFFWTYLLWLWSHFY
jgi:hypothetical protein